MTDGTTLRNAQLGKGGEWRIVCIQRREVDLLFYLMASYRDANFCDVVGAFHSLVELAGLGELNRKKRMQVCSILLEDSYADGMTRPTTQNHHDSLPSG